jgi:tetratricopeptide (TPR) repeat protein
MMNVGSKTPGFIFSALLAIVVMFAPSAFAAEEKEEPKYANVKTKKVKAISQKLAKQLEPIREAADVEQWNVALEGLEDINLDKLKSHEKAEVYNFYGYIYYAKEDMKNSIRYYTKAVKEPDAADTLIQRTLYTLAQLNLVTENYAEAIKLFKQWMATQEIIGPDAYAMLGTAYYSNQDMNNALVNVEKAIEMRESKGMLPQENWYSLQRAIYYERKDYKKVISILNKLVASYPNVRYWREMAGMYAELENEKKQRATYDIAYMQDGLTSEGQVMGMAYLLLAAEVPWYAAKVIQKGIGDGIVEGTEKNLQVLGSALYQAKELNKALPVMELAASKSKTGESYARLAGIYADLEKFDEAIRTASEALKRGDLARTDLANMVLGTAYYNTKKYDQAVKAFNRAAKDKRSKKAAQQWLKYVDSERKREKALADV